MGKNCVAALSSMDMPMNANEAKSSGPALRELAGLLPDLGEFYRDVHPFSIPHYKQVSNRWSSRAVRGCQASSRINGNAPSPLS